MKKNLFIGALAVFALTACSQDEVVDVNNYGNEISFSTVSNKGSRAQHSYCNNDMPDEIKVTAYTTISNNMYFDWDVYSKGGNGAVSNSTHYTVKDGAARFWPESEALTFFATAGYTGTTSVKDGIATISDYTIAATVNGDAANQEDILYAVATNCKKPEPVGNAQSTGVQSLNFRHALSQIVFKAKNTSNNLYVVIDGVSVANVKNKGTFTFDTDTKENWQDHDDSYVAPAEGNEDKNDENHNNNAGSWDANTLEGSATYEVTFSQKTIVNDAEVVTLTDDEGDMLTDALLLMPQSNTTEAKLKVRCSIYNMAGDSYVSGDVAIFGEKGTAYLVIDLKEFSWEPGNKYIYTFNFGGNAGGKDEEGNDVLVPISFDVTVDDFDVVSDEQKDVNPAPEPAPAE